MRSPGPIHLFGCWTEAQKSRIIDAMKLLASRISSLFLLAALITGAAGAALPVLSARAATGAEALPISGVTIEAPAGKQGDSRPLLSISVVDTLINPFDALALERTLEQLSDRLPQYRWRQMVIPAADAEEALLSNKPDFLLAPSGFAAYAQLSSRVSAVRIATRRTVLADRADHSVGSVFIVRAERPWRTLRDIEGLRAASGLQTTVEGWLAAAGEIERAGFDPDHFFSELVVKSNAYPDVISEVLSGGTDVGILPACLLEAVAEKKLARTEGLRVINAKTEGLRCLHSTDLYPGLSLVALGDTDEEKVRDVLGALLSLKDIDGYEWFANVSDAPVLKLFQDLRVGPWAHLRDMSPGAIFLRYREEILFFLGILVLLILNEIRLHVLVKKRTQALSEALERNIRSEAEAAEARQQAAGLERRSVVSQMSGMVAHEINAPVGAIRAYCAVLRILLRNDEKKEERIAVALKGVEHEAEKVAGIVDRVRQYARTGRTEHAEVPLLRVIERGIRSARSELSEEKRERLSVKLHANGLEPVVLGDTLELEVLFLNLVRNAASAAFGSQSEPPFVSVMINRVAAERPEESSGNELDPRPAPGESRIEVVIENSGAKLDDAAMARLAKLGDAIVPSPQGLGIGLGICRGIAEGHGASMKFARREAGGVVVVLSFPEAARKE